MAEWHSVPLGEVVTFQRGFDLPSRYRMTGDVPIVSSAGVTAHHNASMVDPPGVVTGRYGTIGKIYFVAEPFWPLNTTLYVRDFRGNDPRFVYYLLQRFDFASFSGKSGVPGVNRNDLHAESVTKPAEAREQLAIAAALSDVDALLNGLDRLIAKKRDLKQAAMQQLLTGQTRLPGFHGEWEVSSVGREFEIRLGKMLDAEKNVGTPKPYIGNKAVQWGRIDATGLQTMPMSRADMERYRLARGDLLVCEGGEVGRAAIWDAPVEECYYQKALHRLRPLKGFNSQLMAALLNLWADRGALTNYVTQTSIAHLPREKLMDVAMPVPPISEQNAIAELLSDFDAELTALETRRTKTAALKQAMMQELLTGRTRLV